jgi:hypothetical protein
LTSFLLYDPMIWTTELLNPAKGLEQVGSALAKPVNV